ncbi:7TM GPCR, serpentine receptor class d (Srd) family-containing protein [Strongyloides ratti]|uniref:7TM GPCR, serpentine receptor class d (Srd) family-containing protein n=1 Tax=Strongyloides ratti TaxID=34506 RepID=A0A090MX21_STRRB|nr:7TM GPCR, serpentine receptor class d (Srd) family-containing protein [Strongyloides ratti]CEF64674.1 7TM GPCR, serpentine receptor class d (Srd) family-containing protein [Strongyloides ratti]
MLSLLIGHNSYTIFSEELPNDTFKKFLNDSSLTSDLFFNDVIVLGSKITFENWKISILESLIYLIIIFIITFIAIFNYIKHMKSLSSSMSKGTKKLHTDFIKIVLLQSSIPYFLIFPAVITYSIFILFGNIHNIFFLGDIIVKLFCIVPTINAILFIFLPRRNRMMFFLIFTDLRNICLCISKKDNDKDNVFGSVDNLSKYFIKKKSQILKYNKEATGRVRALSVAYIE